MKINAKAWLIKDEADKSKCLYRMQVNGMATASQARLVSLELMDWRAAGNGYNPNTGEMILLFLRDFTNTREWKKWAKTFDKFKLEELDADGNTKKLKTGLNRKVKKVSNIKGKKKKTTSSMKGCKEKVRKEGVRKCGSCGRSGHNRATCPMKTNN